MLSHKSSSDEHQNSCRLLDNTEFAELQTRSSGGLRFWKSWGVGVNLGCVKDKIMSSIMKLGNITKGLDAYGQLQTLIQLLVALPLNSSNRDWISSYLPSLVVVTLVPLFPCSRKMVAYLVGEECEVSGVVFPWVCGNVGVTGYRGSSLTPFFLEEGGGFWFVDV